MLIPTRICVLGTLLLTTATTAGCAARDVSVPSTLGTENVLSARKVPAVAPPATVPLVSARNEPDDGGEEVGSVVYRSWVVDGVLQEEEIPPDRLSRGDTPPQVGPGQGIAITMDTGIEPTRIDLVTYRGTGVDGIPDGKLTDATCAPDPGAGPCTYDIGDRIVLRARVDGGSAVLVVNAGWHLPADLRAAHPSWPSEMSAAWLFRLGAG